MPSINAFGRRWLWLTLPLLACVLLLSGTPDEPRLSIYSNAANYSVTVETRDGIDYAGLLETLEPLGMVSSKASGHHWKLRFNTVDSEYTQGKRQAKVAGTNMNLTDNFVLENDRGLVPVSSLPLLLPRLLGGPVTLHEIARRLFIGDSAVHFTAQIFKSNPPVLVMNFTAPVNPTIATSPGQLSMKFTREGLVGPGASTITFDSQIIPSAAFEESNGAAELIVSGKAPLMASFSNNNRTITIAPPPAAPTAPPATSIQIPPPTPPVSPTPSPSSPAPAESRRYFVLIDPAHGGTDPGATLGNNLLEKDITLAAARRLRAELVSRRVTSLLTRDGDISLTVDQRANLANTLHPAIYLCIHASTQGTGVRVFSSLVPRSSADQGPFVDWDTAQTALLASSQRAVTQLDAALQPLRVPIHSLSAPLHPLNNIRTTAVAIEIASPDSNSGPESPAYQQSVASMVAIGLAAIHDELEAGR